MLITGHMNTAMKGNIDCRGNTLKDVYGTTVLGLINYEFNMNDNVFK